MKLKESFVVVLVMLLYILMVPLFVCIGLWVYAVKTYRSLTMKNYPPKWCCDSVPRCDGCPFRPENKRRLEKLKQQDEERRRARAASNL